MKKVLAIVTLIVLALAGCRSTPETQPGAGIDDRQPGKSGAPGEGATPGSADGARPGGPVVIPSDQGRGPEGVNVGILKQRSVFFDYDSDAIKEQFRPMIQAHAQYLAKNRGVKMLVQGNTDERGSREYNLALGQRRAEALKKMLVLLGAQDSQIEATSLGEEKPRRAGRSEEDYAENRRGDLLYNGEF